MNNQKRIEEVAELLRAQIHKDICVSTACVKVLETLPEFKSPPKSEWVECWERMPNVFPIRDVLVRYDGGIAKCTANEVPGFCNALAWMEIPPYVPPESELVRLARENAKHYFGASGCITAVQFIKDMERKIADARDDRSREGNQDVENV